MRIVYIILMILVAIVAVVFAAQNSTPVTVTLFGLTANASLSIVLVITFGAGILLGMLFLLPSILKRMRALSTQKKKTRSFEKRLNQAPSSENAPQEPLRATETADEMAHNAKKARSESAKDQEDA